MRITSLARRATWTSARIRPVGVSRSERHASPGSSPSMSAVRRSCNHPIASDPATRILRYRDRSTRARRPASGSTMLTPAIIGGVDVPTTLLVTNDFPPSVGGIQRTLEALARELPSDRIGVFCSSSPDDGLYDASAPFRVFRQPERFLWATRDVASRVGQAAQEMDARVILF